MTVIFSDTKQINAIDETNSDAYYSVEGVKLTGQSGLGYRFLAKTLEQVPQDGMTPVTENEYLLPVQINNDSLVFFKNALNLPQYVLDEGVNVTEDMARRFAYKWLEGKEA